MQLLNVLTGSSLDRMPEMTETQTPGRKPKKKKDKESHNAVERHRKKKINSGINRIGNLLPCSQALKQSKNMILDQAFRYITELKKQNDSMLLEGGDKVQAEEICRLRRQLNELRKENDHYIELLKAHDINHKEDPTTHWKGKKRCAKVAKVTPTHQLPKQTVVHCNGNISSTAGKEASPGKQPVSDASVGLRVNGPLLHVTPTLSTPVLLPASAAAPTQSTSGLRVIEQCMVETATTEPTPSSSVSFITLQIPAATKAQLQQSQCAAPALAPALSIITSASHPTNESPASTVSTNTMSTQALTRAIRQETASRNISYAALPNSQAVLRAGAAGSTQTTWTTLPMAGNTLQPVCQSVPAAKITNTPQTVQQVTVCPIGPKPSVCPIQIQMKPPMPTQQSPVGGHIQTQPFQRQCQLHPTVSNQGQPQPQCAVLPQSAVVPQPAVVAHPAVVTQSQAAASLVQHPPTALILQPQPQATVLPLLQTMQVLQVNPAAAKTAAVTPPQSTNNPNVVILPCACPTQPVVREEITNQNPCPQIVIIQAPNQAATATQNSQVGITPPAVPAVSTQLPTTSPVTTASLQTVGGKQLVHILPRPAVQPQVSHPQPVTTTSAAPAPTPPQMITLNGQVFALHPMTMSEKGNAHTGQSTLQLIQPTTTEEPSTNVALNTLGALSSLNQSISQGSPINISSHSTSQPQPASTAAVQLNQLPTSSSSISAATPTPPSQQLQVQCATLAPPVSLNDASKSSGKRVNATSTTKKATAKRTKHGKKKETSQTQNTAAVPLKPREAETLQVTASQPEQALNVKTKSIQAPLTSSTETNTTTRGSTGNVDSSESPLKKNTPSPAQMSSLTLPKSSSSAPQSESPVTPVITTTVTAVCATYIKPQVSASKPTTTMSSNSSTVAKASVQEEGEKQANTNSVNSTTQNKSASTSAALSHIKPVVSSVVATETLTTSNTVSIASTPAACIKTTPPTPVSLCQAAKPASPCLLSGSRTRNTPPNKKTEALPTISSVSTVVATPTLVSTAVAASVTSSALRKRHAAQIDDANTANPTSCHHAIEIKPQQPPRTDRAVQEARRSTAAAAPGKDHLLASEAPTRKEFALPQQVYTNLDDQSIEHSISSSRQTDSPMAGGGRGFSVASMLPQGHSIGASSSSFGAFTFTSEQADMLALAMLEQDNPGRRSGGCSVNNTSSNHSTTTWEPPKTTSVSSSKERTSAGQQAKAEKPVDSGAGKSAVDVSVRRPVGDRHPQSISYSQPQPLPQAQSQSGTGASLSVNNLIRPSSNHQLYPSSPVLAPQQGSAPSPAVTSAHTVQSNNALSPCSRTAQVEYTPLKSALMRAQAERQGKIISKRQAQEEVMLTSGKRPKPCPPSSTTVAHLDVKTQDHSQGMVGQQSSSAIMTRINQEGGGPLFSTNTFINPIARPLDTHCPPQVAHEQNQPGVLHFPQGHPQHPITQPGQHLGGNLYMKQQQQHQQQQHEQQRHHLYHLQQHLMQPDPAQRHSLHQRALQQQQQQEQQHVHKKRGLIRGGQTGSAASLQQKQHHLEKSGVQQQHSHQQQQQTQHQQHPQQQHQQPAQHQQSHPQQHQQQTHQQPPQAQHQQHHQQQLQQQQQQQQQQQSSHSRHQQHLQQQIQQQQQQQHFRHQEKSCEAQAAGSRSHHSGHLTQQDHLKPPQDHNALQRMMSSRSLEQQLISPSNPVSRPSDTSCASSRQERHRVSSYSAEALIGKSSSSSDQQQRMGLHLQSVRGGSQEQPDLRGYMEASRGKANIAQSHNPQTRLPVDHQGSTDIQRVTECPPFKGMSGGGEAAQQLSGFELQVSRGSDMAPKSVPPSQRGSQGQQGGFRMGVGPAADARNRGGYSGAHPSSQAMQVGPVLNRDQEGCHQSFMQSLLSPHLPEPSNHQRSVQCCPPVSMDYSCVSATGDIQAKVSSPSVPPTQKTPTMRLVEGNKGHISQVGANMHAGPGVRAGPPQPPPPHSSSEPGRSSAPSRAPAPVSQHSRQINRDSQPTKLRPGDRQRSGTIRTSNPFEPEGHLPLLTRPQSGGEARRSTIVRFMAETQPPTDNNLVPDQHLPQNFGFPFIPEGGMNPPINANSTFIPPVSQSSSTRTPSLLPVEPQNTLPSFYPSYSPAAHPSLPSDVTLQYFPNQMFTSPSADKASAPPLNNRFGSILSPPRPVGFGQASFPLLPEMPPMPITNSSGITPHISNFSLTSLFPEIATGMPGDGSAMPMSPLLSLSNTSSSDSSKQPNRPAHNISHILGHDGSSAV